MPYLLDLADACRKSGLKVVEVNGWKTRGHGPMTAVRSILAHHTATSSRATGDYPSLGIVKDGRPDLPGPLSQLGLGRSGTVYVIAAGLSYHAGQVINPWASNSLSIGIEVEHDGIAPFPAALYPKLVRLVAALASHYDWEGKPGPEDDAKVWGHKEMNKVDGKIDPNFDMDRFRADVAACDLDTPAGGEEDMPLTQKDVELIGAAFDKWMPNWIKAHSHIVASAVWSATYGSAEDTATARMIRAFRGSEAAAAGIKALSEQVAGLAAGTGADPKVLQDAVTRAVEDVLSRATTTTVVEPKEAA